MPAIQLETFSDQKVDRFREIGANSWKALIPPADEHELGRRNLNSLLANRQEIHVNQFPEIEEDSWKNQTPLPGEDKLGRQHLNLLLAARQEILSRYHPVVRQNYLRKEKMEQHAMKEVNRLRNPLPL